jgi:phage repressor protein C with HTH and peptisase S24 domain
MDKEVRIASKGNWIVSDKKQKDRIDGYYLIQAANLSQVRFLEFIPTGAIRVIADARNSEYTLEPNQLDSICIIGRVIWWENRD